MKAILLLLLVPFLILPAYAEALSVEVTKFSTIDEPTRSSWTSQDMTVTVPFTVNEFWSEPDYCGLFVDIDTGNPYYRCTFWANMFTETPNELWPVYPYVEPEPEPEPKVIPEETEELTPAQEQLQYVMNTIEYLKSKNDPSPSEQWYVEQFEDRLTFCSYGILAAEAFQEKQDFVISPDWIQLVDGVPVYVFPEMDTRSSFNVRDGSPAAQIYWDNQACKGQGNFYDPDVSPQHYKDFLMKPLPAGEICTYESIQKHGYDCQPEHRFQATVKKAYTDRQDGNLAEEESRAWDDGICKNPVFDQRTRDQFNCPKPVYEGASFGEINQPVTQGPRSTVEAKVYWHALSCGLPIEPVVNERYLGYLEDLAETYTCDIEHRITGIMVFDPRTSNAETIEQWIAYYELKKEARK